MGKLDAEEAVQPGVEFMQFVGAVGVGFFCGINSKNRFLSVSL